MNQTNQSLFENLLYAEGGWEIQLMLGVIQAVTWYVYMPTFAKYVVKPLIKRSSFKNQWIDLHHQTYKASGIDVSRESAFDLSCWSVPMITQHALGGFCALIFCLNIFSPRVNAAIGCHGALMEFGFELQDTISRTYQAKYGNEVEKANNNPTILKLIYAHHSVGLCLVIPLNMWFRDHILYHESNVLLQGAAFIALGLQQIGFTLDMTTIEAATKMKYLSIISFVVILYTRLIRYVPLNYEFNMHCREMGWTTFANIAAFVSLGLSFFNVVIIRSAYKKMRKFSNPEKTQQNAIKSKEKHNQPTSEPEPKKTK